MCRASHPEVLPMPTMGALNASTPSSLGPRDLKILSSDTVRMPQVPYGGTDRSDPFFWLDGSEGSLEYRGVSIEGADISRESARSARSAAVLNTKPLAATTIHYGSPDPALQHRSAFPVASASVWQVKQKLRSRGRSTIRQRIPWIAAFGRRARSLCWHWRRSSSVQSED